jgi:hypothetical protein
LSASGLPNTVIALRTELNLGEDVFDAVTAKKIRDITGEEMDQRYPPTKESKSLPTQLASVNVTSFN